jgi:hypothetical protein
MRSFGITRFVTELPTIFTILVPLVIVIAVLISPTRVLANNSLAREAAGGIEFIKSDQIRILEEVLEISPHNVRVKYRYLNESDQDVNATVAFPLPLRDCNSPNVLPRHYADLEQTFKVRVNGRPVSTTTARKAIIDVRDATAQLHEIGLSDRQILEYCHNGDQVSNRIQNSNLTTNQEAALAKLRREEWQVVPWDLAVTMFWQQTFPAGKEIVVEHEYTPAAGGSYTIPYSRSSGLNPDQSQVSGGDKNEACHRESHQS